MARRGEVWYADLSPTQGSEQAGRRPVLVVQNDAVNRFTTTVVVVPLTTNLRRAVLPSCVRIAAGEGGLSAESVALCHQVRALDASRLRDRQGQVGQEVMVAIDACFLFTLGISVGE